VNDEALALLSRLLWPKTRGQSKHCGPSDRVYARPDLALVPNTVTARLSEDNFLNGFMILQFSNEWFWNKVFLIAIIACAVFHKISNFRQKMFCFTSVRYTSTTINRTGIWNNWHEYPLSFTGQYLKNGRPPDYLPNESSIPRSCIWRATFRSAVDVCSSNTDLSLIVEWRAQRNFWVFARSPGNDLTEYLIMIHVICHERCDFLVGYFWRVEPFQCFSGRITIGLFCGRQAWYPVHSMALPLLAGARR
jgi:hypothetical protein